MPLTVAVNLISLTDVVPALEPYSLPSLLLSSRRLSRCATSSARLNLRQRRPAGHGNAGIRYNLLFIVPARSYWLLIPVPR